MRDILNPANLTLFVGFFLLVVACFIIGGPILAIRSSSLFIVTFIGGWLFRSYVDKKKRR
jgi:hypothetical protein